MNKILSLRTRTGRTDPANAGTAVPQAPAGIRFIPGERVLLLSVTLPPMPASQRAAAATFAAEDSIAQTLEDVHVAVGPELTPGQWLVGVVARTDLAMAIGPGLRLLPDTLALPVPPLGQWSVAEDQGRVLIRLADGTGLVTRAPGLPLLHQCAGAPAITLYAGQIAPDHLTAPWPAMTLPARFDLTNRQSRTLAVPPLARRLLAVAAITALGHLAILTADTISLSRQQGALAAQLRAAAGTTADAGIDALLSRILAPPPPTVRDAGFLPLLAAGFAAMSGQSGRVTLRELRYGAEGNSLALTLLAPDLGSLQQIESELVSAGLDVTSGPATSANGAAEQQLTLRGAGS